jgi:hypothetical protein
LWAVEKSSDLGSNVLTEVAAGGPKLCSQRVAAVDDPDEILHVTASEEIALPPVLECLPLGGDEQGSRADPHVEICRERHR